MRFPFGCTVTLGQYAEIVLLRFKRAILYLIDEFRHYLAGSKLGSDTPED
ncbi:hypothetical protein CSC02_0711 [Enterobacter hormaechei subsp. hoffmannii]|nr:hypothetical protein CSC02_0711 [Enterobacter hormaechei subsp. hoffmannii]